MPTQGLRGCFTTACVCVCGSPRVVSCFYLPFIFCVSLSRCTWHLDCRPGGVAGLHVREALDDHAYVRFLLSSHRQRNDKRKQISPDGDTNLTVRKAPHFRFLFFSTLGEPILATNSFGCFFEMMTKFCACFCFTAYRNSPIGRRLLWLSWDSSLFTNLEYMASEQFLR